MKGQDPVVEVSEVVTKVDGYRAEISKVVEAGGTGGRGPLPQEDEADQ